MKEKMIRVLECIKAIDDSDSARGLAVLKKHGLDYKNVDSAVDFVDKLVDDMLFELQES